jgi:hypothetical protein
MPLETIRISSIRDADDRSDRFDRYARQQPAPSSPANKKEEVGHRTLLAVLGDAVFVIIPTQGKKCGYGGQFKLHKTLPAPPCMYDRDCWQRSPYQAIHQAIALLLLRSYHRKAAIRKGISSARRFDSAKSSSSSILCAVDALERRRCRRSRRSRTGTGHARHALSGSSHCWRIAPQREKIQ